MSSFTAEFDLLLELYCYGTIQVFSISFSFYIKVLLLIAAVVLFLE